MINTYVLELSRADYRGWGVREESGLEKGGKLMILVRRVLKELKKNKSRNGWKCSRIILLEIV